MKNFGRGENEPMMALSEFVCEAIPTADIKSHPDAARTDRRAKNGKLPKKPKSKAKAKHQKSSKRKPPGKKRPSV